MKQEFFNGIFSEVKEENNFVNLIHIFFLSYAPFSNRVCCS